MILTAADLLSEALKLPEAKRAELAERLFDSIPAPESDYDQMTEEEFKAEMLRRSAELKADPSLGIPWEQVRDME